VAQQNDKIGDILDSLEEKADREDKVSVNDVVTVLGHRGHGPFLFVPALLGASPVAGIPTIPTLIAIIIALFAAQIAAGRSHLWLPGFLRSRAGSRDKMTSAVQHLRPVARWMDRWFHGRLQQLTSDTATRIAGGIVVLLCLVVPPLELVPLAAILPFAAIALFGLALTLRDGLLMAIGFVLAAAGLLGGAQYLL
jgi:hypothetical protein